MRDFRDAKTMAKTLRAEIEDVPWGARTVSVIDPFGNTLRFNEYR